MNTSKNLAFAINVNVNERFSNEYINFHKLLEDLTNNLPGFVAEGIGNKARKPEITENTTVIVTDEFSLVSSESEQKKRLIAIGVSEKYNVSLENEDSIFVKLGNSKFPTIPVYDLKRDYATILAKLKRYLLVTFEENNEEDTQIVHHGQFVRVGNQVIPYKQFTAMNQQKVYNKRPENPAQRFVNLLTNLLS